MTEDEKALFQNLIAGNANAIKPEDSSHSSGESLTVNKRKRDLKKTESQEESVEQGRVRKPKTNFSDDFVYDDIMMRGNACAKLQKEQNKQ